MSATSVQDEGCSKRFTASPSTSARSRSHRTSHASPPPSGQAVALVLEPPPNTPTRAACLVGDVLVTVHRTGVRLYRTEPSGKAVGTADALSSVWHLYDKREACELTDAYLCAAAEPVTHASGHGGGSSNDTSSTHGDTTGHTVATAYSRYFCVAAGNDRTAQSVCILSTAGHFCLHHELHGRHRVVALHFAQLSMDPLHESSVAPIVVSVDEAGGVVLYNVARESAARLQRRECGLSRLLDSDVAVHRQSAVNATREEAKVMDEIALYEAASRTVPTTTTTAAAEDVATDGAYRLDAGVATSVVLVGPCVELCNRCHNLFSPPGCGEVTMSTAAAARGKLSLSAGATSGRYMAASIVLSTRARDLPSKTATPQTDGARVSDNTSVDSDDGVEAELGITFLRVLCSPMRAYVWHEIELLREPAPRAVCDAGVALATHTHAPGQPMTVLVGRPRWRFWRLSGCSGQLLETRQVVEVKNGERAMMGHDNEESREREYLIRWLPLGRQVLASAVRGGSGEDRELWDCAAAITSDGSVLLLGRDAATTMEQSTHGLPVMSINSPHEQPGTCAGGPLLSDDAAAECFEQKERQTLEAWLAEVEEAVQADESNGTAGGTHEGGPAPRGESLKGVVSTLKVAQLGQVTPELASSDYRVLMRLYASLDRSRSHTYRIRRSSRRRRHREAASSSSAVGSAASAATHGRSPSMASAAVSSSAASTPSASSAHRRRRRLSNGADYGTCSGVATHAWPDRIATDAANRSLVVFFCHDAAAPLRIALPFAPAAPPAPIAKERTPGHGGTTATATAEAASGGGSGAGGLWSATRTALNAAAAPTAWLSLGPHGRREASVSTPTVHSTPTATGGGTEGVSRGLGLMRPLAAALMHWTHGGNEKEEEEHSAKKGGTYSESREAGQPRTEPPPADTPRTPSPRREGTERCAAATPSVKRTTSSARSRDFPSPRIAAAAVPIRVAGASSRHRRHRLSATGTTAPAVTPDATMTANEWAVSDSAQGALQRRYMQEQVRQAVERDESCASAAHPVATASTPGEAITAALDRVLQREEPAARTALRYAWEDGHTQLYVDFTLAADAVAAHEERQRTDRAARQARERRLYLRDVGSDMRLVGVGAPVSPPSPTLVPQPPPAPSRAAALPAANCSVAFLQRYRELREGRRRLRDRSGIFDFGVYATTGALPQPLLDLQERDKCRFELADLRRQQARRLAGLDPYEWVTLFQNEERTSGGQAEWVPHPTFPYDDRDGCVADLAVWNRTAGPREPGAYVWDTSDGAEGHRSSHQNGSPTTTRVKALTRALRDWTLGPWQYAPRWPTAAADAAADDTLWGPQERPESRVRRRQLTRRRVNVKVQATREEMMAAHQRELEALRMELGL